MRPITLALAGNNIINLKYGTDCQRIFFYKKRDSSHRFILGERKRTMTIRLDWICLTYLVWEYTLLFSSFESHFSKWES